MTTTKRRCLYTPDIAQIFGEELARKHARKHGLDEAQAVKTAEPVKDRTVNRYWQECVSGRYVGKPMPAPTYHPGGPNRGKVPVWVPAEGETVEQLEQQFRVWWNSRPGRGGKTAIAEKVTCDCCGQQITPGTLCDRKLSQRAKAAAA